jgi:transcriptional regulator with XRE-family HTH domain
MSGERIIQRFGEKLHILRVRNGMTLKELALALGYRAHGHISELEAGKKLPTVEFALKVARLFDVTTDQLLRDELDVGIATQGHVPEESNDISVCE